MPTAKPRITITLEPHAYETLSRLSAAGGESMSSIVTQFVDLALPSLERVVLVLERARAAPQEARDGLVAAVERAERELMPAIEAALDQGDLFLAQVAAASTPAPAQRGRAAVALPSPKAAAAVSTPVPVTRGSGPLSGGSAVVPPGTRKGVRHGPL